MGNEMPGRKRYSLSELVHQCDPAAPVPEDVGAWKRMRPASLEQSVVEGQVDVHDAILGFLDRINNHYDIIQLILFGSRARGDYHVESDADVAVILQGEPGDFVETKLAMAGHAFHVLVETGLLVQAFPIWETEWQQPERASNPAILTNIAREGLIIWSQLEWPG